MENLEIVLGDSRMLARFSVDAYERLDQEFNGLIDVAVIKDFLIKLVTQGDIDEIEDEDMEEIDKFLDKDKDMVVKIKEDVSQEDRVIKVLSMC